MSVKTYTYYVGTLSRYVLLAADTAGEALEAGKLHPDLAGGTILTVRVATKDEIEMMEWHEDRLAQEGTVDGRQS